MKVAPQSLCTYAFTPTKEAPVFRINDICFASMRNYAAGIKDFAMYVARVKTDLLNRKDYSLWRKYADYIINRSPWAKAYSTKSVSSLMKYGAKFNTSHTFSFVLSAAVALREGHEFAHAMRCFCYLLSKGIPENTAYVISRIFKYDAATKRFYSQKWGNHHATFSTGTDFHHLSRFFAKGFNGIGEPMKDRASSYQIFEVVGKTSDYRKTVKYSIFDWVEENIKGEVAGGGWNKVTSYSQQDVLDLCDKFTQVANTINGE